MSVRIERFEAAVEKYLQRYKLQSLAEVTDDKILDFVSQPEIHAYLTRPSKDVHFTDEGEPEYESSKEIELYELFKRSNALAIPYRAERDEKIGFSSGTSYLSSKALMNRVSPEESHIHFVGYDNNAVSIGHKLRLLEGCKNLFLNRDSYDADRMLFLDGEGEKITFDKGENVLVFPINEGGHAVLLYALFDSTSQQITRLGVFDSEYGEGVANKIEEKLNFHFKKYDGVKPYSVAKVTLDVQKLAKDNHCAIYRASIAGALVEALKDPQLLDSIKEPAIENKHLEFIVGRAVKSHLPQYFVHDSGDYLAKDLDEVRGFNLKARWDLGGEHLNEIIREYKLNSKSCFEPGASKF